VNDSGFTIPPKIYDFLKYVALVILPAMAALVLGIGQLLGWGPAVIVAGIITLTDTFLGAILGRSSSNFKAEAPDVFGDLVIMQDPRGSVEGMRIVGHKDNPIFHEGGQVVLNVKREQNLQ
jgi:hypothetical protein